MRHLHTVYDFHNERLIPYFSFLPAPFIIIGLGIFIYNLFYGDREGTNKWGINKRMFNMFFGLGFALFALSLSAMTISSKLGGHSTAEAIFNSGKYKTVEGIVENYHPMPPGGHQSESFTVDGIKFEFYGSTLGDPGYNIPAVDGGVFKAGLFVRLTYANYYDNNVILKIEAE
jgi:hypothetical protein